VDKPGPAEADETISGTEKEVDMNVGNEADADTADGGTDSEALGETTVGTEGDRRGELEMIMGSPVGSRCSVAVTDDRTGSATGATGPGSRSWSVS